MIATLNRDRNIIYLYHDKLFTGSRSDVTGVEVRPDGLPRSRSRTSAAREARLNGAATCCAAPAPR